MVRRDGYAEVGAAMRATMGGACTAGLSVHQWRTLAAVVAYTGAYSRLTDRVYLDQLAAFVYGVEQSQRWMRKKVSASLRQLERRGLVVRRAPSGRPPASSEGPVYVVGIPKKVTPDPGSLSGASSARKGPRSRNQRDPDPGTKVALPVGAPTEEVPEEVPEENDARTSSGTLPGLEPTSQRPAKAGRRPDPHRAAAEAIVNDWWQRQTPRPQQPWIAAVKVATKAHRDGWTDDELAQALEEVPAVSGAALDMWRNRRNGHTGRTATEARRERDLDDIRRAAQAAAGVAPDGSSATRALPPGRRVG